MIGSRPPSFWLAGRNRGSLATTWCNMLRGLNGIVSATNSLVEMLKVACLRIHDENVQDLMRTVSKMIYDSLHTLNQQVASLFVDSGVFLSY